MTPQQIFDTVVDHLITQGRPALDPVHQACMYRTPDGLKCAVGILIPDDVYSPNLEGAGTLSDVSFAIGLEDHFKLLSALQLAHDHAGYHLNGSFDWPELKSELIDIAHGHNLDATILETIP